MCAPLKQISFSPPDITEAEIQEVAEALRSGWITTGPRTKQLALNLPLALLKELPQCIALGHGGHDFDGLLPHGVYKLHTA